MPRGSTCADSHFKIAGAGRRKLCYEPRWRVVRTAAANVPTTHSVPERITALKYLRCLKSGGACFTEVVASNKGGNADCLRVSWVGTRTYPCAVINLIETSSKCPNI